VGDFPRGRSQREAGKCGRHQGIHERSRTCKAAVVLDELRAVAASRCGRPRGKIARHAYPFGPRVGFAYGLGNRTVLRGATGIV